MVQGQLDAKDRKYAVGLLRDETFGAEELGGYVQDIGSLKRNFGGSFEEQSKKILAAGTISKFDPGEIAVQMTKMAAADKKAGGGKSEDELLATYMTILAKEPIKRAAGTETTEFLKTGDSFEGTDKDT